MVAYGTEKPQAYRPRLVDERLQRLLSTFGAVEIRGTKWCGKSWAALAFGESVVHLDDPNVKALAEADPALALQGARPHVVDEWLFLIAFIFRKSRDKSFGFHDDCFAS